MASNMTNIAFCTQVQAGCIGQKEESSNEHKGTNYDHIKKDLCMKLDQRQPRKSNDELKQEYREEYPNTIKKLFDHELDANRGALTRKQCAVILTLGFDQMTRIGSKRVEDMRKSVNGKVATKFHENNMPNFWVGVKN